MPNTDAVELVLERNAFYRRLHFLALGAFIISIMVAMLLVSTIIYIKRNPPNPYYFAADNVTRLLQIIPVNTPNMSPEDVIKWTIKAVQASFTFDYVNYRSQLQGAQSYFTPYGWSEYMKALNASRNLYGVIQRKWVAVAQVVGPPVKITEGILGGAYAWKYKMPVLLNFYRPPAYNEENKGVIPMEVTVIVQRRPALEGNSGLGIVQLLSSNVSAINNQMR